MPSGTDSPSPTDSLERAEAALEAATPAPVPTSQPARARVPIRGILRRLAAALALIGLVALALWQASPVALVEAQAAGRAGDPVTALRRAMDHLDRAPRNADAALVAARALSRLQFPDRAEPYYAQARRSGLLGLDDLQARALALTQANRLDEAVAAYEEILKSQPDEPLALRRLATVRYSQMRLREAQALAERLAQIPGQAVVGYTLLGSIQHEQKHPERAAAAYERALALDPELRTVPLPPQIFLTNLAQDLIAAGQPARAREILLRVLAGNRDAVQMDLLGLAYQSEGALDDSERCYRRAAEWDPKLFSAWLHLGRLLMQPNQNRPDDAIACLKRAEELAPTSFEPPYSLSLAYRRLGRDDEAERYQKRTEDLRRQQGAPATGMGVMPGQAP
jgi:tetratricopeptide (TPR) repeat protein